MRRLTLVIALIGLLAWCGLLFGIGLDDLTNRHTEPGVIFALVVLPFLIVCAGYALWRVMRPAVERRRSQTASRR